MDLVIGFFPWIVFGLLSHTHKQAALLVALGSAAVQVVAHFRSPKVLELVSLTFFSFAFLALFVFRWHAFASHLGLIVHIILASVAWGSLLCGAPFTLQYAREKVPEQHWHEPSFIRTNQWITAVWGVDFVLQAVILEWQARHGGGLASAISLLTSISAMVFTAWYPAYMRKTAPLPPVAETKVQPEAEGSETKLA